MKNLTQKLLACTMMMFVTAVSERSFAQQAPNFKRLKGCGFDYMKTASRQNANFAARISKPTVADNGQKIVVQVIFHVIYSDDDQNISAYNIKKEIADLNRDYQLMNADIDQVYPLYKNLVGNPNISFVLADTLFGGSPDKGIKRVSGPSKRNLWKTDPVISPDRYLNVYSGNISSDGFTYTNPWNNPQTDAVFLHYEWIGGSYRLLSHETGHWLGLYHIFEGGCSVENDGITDTPPQLKATGLGLGCDPNNSTGNQCNGSTLPMFNNYMDYSDCRVMFTKGQADKMRADIFMYRPTVFR